MTESIHKKKVVKDFANSLSEEWMEGEVGGQKGGGIGLICKIKRLF